MRRLALASVFVVFASVLVTSTSLAQRPGGGGVQPLCVTGCGGGGPGPSDVVVMLFSPSTRADTIIVSNPPANATVTFKVKNVGTQYTDTYTLTMGCTGSATCVSESQGSATLAHGASVNVIVTFMPGAGGTSGTVQLTADDGNGFSDYNWYDVVSVPGTAPIISLTPYSSGLQPASDGVVYQHSLPAIGSMGVQRSLTLVYNSATAHPTAIITVDVPSPGGSPLPTTYQLQVQRADNLSYLNLLNGTLSTSVYYAASANGQTTRMVAAIDLKANNLATGAYPINVVVTAAYPLGTTASSTPSRILVNDQSASAFGAGVGIAGIPQLFPNPTSGYGMLLVDGSGGMEYFDRSCSTCTPFVSPAGDSRTLATYNDPTLGGLYRLTALDGSIVADFQMSGLPLRTWSPSGMRDLAFGYTSGLLTSVTDTTGRGFTLSYSGAMLSQISDGHRTTGVSIVSGQLTAVTDPDGLGETLAYGANSMLSQVADRAGGLWTYAYNALNQEQSVTDPTATDYTGAQVRPVTSTVTMAQIVWQPAVPGTLASSPKANVRPDTVMLSATDPLGNVTRAAHDRFGLATKVVDALGQVTTITRDTLGQMTQTVQPNGHTVTNSYSGYLLTTHTDNTTGEVLSYTYDANQRPIKVSGGAARVDQFYHDGSQGPVGMPKLGYVGNSNAAGQWPPTGGDTLVHHYTDAYGRDTAVTDGLGHRSRWIYSSPAGGGNLGTLVDASGHVTTFLYDLNGQWSFANINNATYVSRAVDAMNRDTAVTNPSSVTRYRYDPLRLTRVIDPKGQLYKFDVNAWGLRVATHDLADTTLADSAWYDRGGRLRTVKARRGDVITMTYDSLGRLLTRSGPDFPTATFRYGLNGSWRVASNANATDSIVLDQAGRVTAVWETVGGIAYQMSYSYDSHGRLTSRSAPSGGGVTGSSLTLAYDRNLGPLDTVWALGTSAVYSFDSELKPLGIAYNGGAWWHNLGYDSLHQVSSDYFSVAQLTNDFALTWVYDSLGHIVSATWPPSASHQPEFMRYDSTGQLIIACSGNQPYCYDEYGQNLYNFYGRSYTYDAAGNRTDVLANAVVGAGNRLLQFKGYGLAYDGNGAVVQRSGLGPNGSWNNLDTTRLHWNAQRELVRVERWTAAGSHTVDTLLYDALGRRVGKKVNSATTWFVYDGSQVSLDIASPSNTLAAEYAFTGDDLFGIRTSAITGVPVTLNGTVVGLAAAQNGTEIKRYAVLASPWGQQTSDTGLVVRYRMGSQEYDQEIGLYHLGARYYDPILGRFLSEDPLGIAGGLNLYAYADNNPVDERDPTGLYSCAPVTGSNGRPAGQICTYTLDDCLVIGVPGAECDPGSWQFRAACNRINGSVNGATCVVIVPDPYGGSGPGGSGPGAGDSHNSCPASGGLRLPDYVAVNVNIAIPMPLTGTLIGWSGTASVDRYGDWFFSPLGLGVGKTATAVSGSLTVNWLDQRTMPSRQHLASFLSSSGFNFTAAYGIAASQSYTPGSGMATGFGVGTPQVGLSYNYSFKGGNVGVTSCK